jgi:hypothetical protein
VGGFGHDKRTSHDDYDLTLRLARSGWKGAQIPFVHIHEKHGDSRSQIARSAGLVTRDLMEMWHFAIVTLWSGKNIDVHLKVLKWLATAQLPSHVSLHWMVEQNSQMQQILNKWIAQYGKKFLSITMYDAAKTTAPFGGMNGSAPPDARHHRVAGLYNAIFPHLREDIVVTLEDDTLPPLNGVIKLMNLIRPGGRTAVSAGVYRSRHNPTHICASTDLKLWRKSPRADAIGATIHQPFRVGMTGGGFACIANWALQKCLPMQCNYSERGYLMGWDGNLGMDLTALGYVLMAHPSVFCRHDCPEVLRYLESTSQRSG